MTVRVLHFFKTYYPDTFGGIERVIHAIATGTQAYDVATTVLSLSRNPQRNSLDFDGHRAEKAPLDFEFLSTGFSFRALARFRALCAQADVLHYHYPWPVADAAHLLWCRNKPALVTYHADIVRHGLARRLYAPLMQRFLSSLPVVVATSPAYAETSPALRRHRDRVRIIPLGLADRTGEVDAPTVARWRGELPGQFFLFTGTLRYYKGVHILLEAAQRSNLPVVVIGGGPNEARWRREAVRRGLSNIRFLGELPDRDKYAILSLCAGFVFPSHLRAEAFGLALVEAAMFSKPMISCEIGTGTSYINRDGETGIVVAPDDAGAVCRAMRELAADPDLRLRLGAAARRRYEELFTARAMNGAYAEIYYALASRTGKGFDPPISR